ATGRATGPHLHWGMKWRDARIDPLLLAGPMPAAD
ncbi:M23 family peptidase, partial [Sphingomonas sp. AOB5]|nr:M23 family peptidase [Sphingomonas sp. AOB5]